MYRHHIPGWTDIVANACAETQRNPQAFTSGIYSGQNYAACALDNAASAGYADEEYGGVNEYGYEAAVFRLTPADAQILEHRDKNGELLSRFVIVRDDNSKVEMSEYQTDQEMDAFVGAIEDDISTCDEEYERQEERDNDRPTASPRPEPEPHELPPLL